MEPNIKVITITPENLEKMKEEGPFAALLGAQGIEGLPEGFKEFLKEKVKDLDLPNLKALLLQERTTPMTFEEFETILKRNNKFKIGDVVELRQEFNCLYQQPRAGEPCVVSQVLPAPEIYGDRNEQVRRLDFAIPFKEPHGDHNHYVEFMFDSRHFKLHEPKKDSE